MRIGRWTIRKTADIKAEQARRDRTKVVSATLVGRLLHTHRQDKAIAARWGLSEGQKEQEADNGQARPLTPQGGGLGYIETPLRQLDVF